MASSRLAQYGILAIVLFVFLAPGLLAHAAVFQGPVVPCGRAGMPDCNLCFLGVLVLNLTKFMMYAIAIPAVGLMVLVGGGMMVVSGGSDTMIKKGKSILTKTVAGALIVFLAWLFVDVTIKTFTGGEQRFLGAIGPWNEVPTSACRL
ncbi:MAG: hypothetical protein HYT42_02290 [Candidatus Sungbacteria bacterium]|nr:hypothetical protein [Candidatus Sungbacteria bacterium]